MGVPFDSGVTNRPGARSGPRAIRLSSQLTNCFGYPWGYKLSDEANIVDYGDVGYYVGANTTKVMLEETYENAKKIFASGSKLLTLGGDHTIPYGMVRAASEKFGKLALLHFDSHQIVHQVQMAIFLMLILLMIYRLRVVLTHLSLLRYLSVQK